MTLPDQSTIKPLGREPRPITFVVADQTPEGYIPVWIDGRNGEPFANVRLTPDDAKRLLAGLARALHPDVHGELEQAGVIVPEALQ